MRSPSHMALAAIGVILGAGLSWALLGCPETGIDDADIFFVYARNLAEGHGFIYNAGGERVEGFTSLSWTLVCSAFMMGFESIERPLLFLNIALGTIAVGRSLKRTERKGLYLAFLCAAPAWFAWAQVSLMETGLWCLIITGLGLALAERRTLAVSVLLPLMVVTRPESMLWGAWVVLLVFAMAEPGRRVRTALGPLIAFALSVALLVGFRLAYFGWPVPNTYYAKVSPGVLQNIMAGMSYLTRYVCSGGVIAILFYVGLRSAAKARLSRDDSFWIAWFLAPGVLIPVWVGGDHFGAFRFYQPLWPLLCLLAANEAPRWFAGIPPRVRRAAVVALVAMGWTLFPFTANLRHEFLIAAEGRANGRALETLFRDLEEWPTVGAITAGGNKLGYPGPVFDLMGLNDTEMAHAPSDGARVKNHSGFNREVFFRRAPDVVLRGDSEEFDDLVLNGLRHDPRFIAMYTRAAPSVGGVSVDAWYKNVLLARLPKERARVFLE